MVKATNHSADSDFEQCMQNAETVRKRLDTLDGCLKRFLIAVSDTATAFESVGNCYVDMATAATVQTGGEQQSAVSMQVNDTRSALYNSARIFTVEMREMKDGQTLANYRSDVHKRIIERMRPLRDEAKKTVVAGKSRSEAYKKYQKATKIVEKKEMKYEAKNKPISESKLYKKQEASREKAYAKLEQTNEHFTALYNNLIVNIETATGQTLDSFVDISTCILQFMLKTVQEVTDDLTKRYPVMDSVFVSKVRSQSPQEMSQSVQEMSQSVQEMGQSPKERSRSPPTMLSRMKTGGMPNIPAAVNEASAPPLYNMTTEPFGNTPGEVENVCLLNYVEVQSDSAVREVSMEQEEQPSTALRPPSARIETCEASANESVRTSCGGVGEKEGKHLDEL
ncbi:hypothetical protein LSM04_002332 [Trypanosoma melophagium]|uniref:uncharacterized protein n=1 Tax=Trypanosoma melophagium TaxID=715481 RepID=UPI00351A4FA6|nr:hypothetical protein LSM04_002332 [Trypanosoma melophagium]